MQGRVEEELPSWSVQEASAMTKRAHGSVVLKWLVTEASESGFVFVCSIKTCKISFTRGPGHVVAQDKFASEGSFHLQRAVVVQTLTGTTLLNVSPRVPRRCRRENRIMTSLNEATLRSSANHSSVRISR